jgi:hypothetical protein
MIRLTDRQDDAGADRRRHTRTDIVRPAKVRGSRTLAYTPAYTVNLSASGALLRLSRAASLAPGDELELLIAWDAQPVLPRAGAVTGTVRRVTKPTPPEQGEADDAAPTGPLVAIEFLRPAISVGSVTVNMPARAAA